MIFNVGNGVKLFQVPMFGDLLKVWRVNLTTPCGASFKEERTQNSCLKKCRQTCYPKLEFLMTTASKHVAYRLKGSCLTQAGVQWPFEAYYSLPQTSGLK
ncbi:uncharacterized protein [Chlorocebus sabaeus]|uniref:uncharacterized protein isoform X2 n=1 Tax=Chlorocebus sabaeus TaxID=60711 RepID=UPI003BF9454B